MKDLQKRQLEEKEEERKRKKMQEEKDSIDVDYDYEADFAANLGDDPLGSFGLLDHADFIPGSEILSKNEALKYIDMKEFKE